MCEPIRPVPLQAQMEAYWIQEIEKEKSKAIELYNTNKKLAGDARKMRKDLDEMKKKIESLKEKRKEDRMFYMGNLKIKVEKSNGELEEANKKLREFNKRLVADERAKVRAEARSAEKEERRRFYGTLSNYYCKKQRMEEALVSMEHIAGGGDTKGFFKDFLDYLFAKGKLSLKFSPNAAFEVYHSLKLSRGRYLRLKKAFVKNKIPDPFPSRSELQKMELQFGSLSDISVKTEKIVDKDGREKEVTICMLRNVRSYIEKRIKALEKEGKLVFDNCTGATIWIGVTGDKGGDEFKLCLIIGNVEKTNSAHHLIPVGMFNGDESAHNISTYLSDVIAQINSLEHISIAMDGELREVPIKQYLVGDMKFQSEMLGHEGGRSTCGCIYCYSTVAKKISEYTRGTNSVTRTEESYKVDSASKAKSNAGRHNVKPDSSFVFSRIPLDRVVPASLHIVMGLAQHYGFDYILDLAKIEDNTSGVPLEKSDKKTERKAKSAVQVWENNVEKLEKYLQSAGCVKTVLDNFAQKRITPLTKEGEGCAAQKCVFLDKHIKQAAIYDARKVECSECFETFHAICSGVLEEDQWLLTNDPEWDFFCLTCSSKATSIGKWCSKVIEDLKKETEEAKERLKEKIEEYNLLMVAVNGMGPVRKSLEKAWKDLGADMSAWTQTFTGNHVLKLLDEDAIDKYLAVLAPSSIIPHVKQYLVAIGKIQKMCVAREMSAVEKEELNKQIRRQSFNLPRPDLNTLG
uniref:Zinc finger PHD-type domain-containing protein n=1 Tax=Caenorhabditis japonica TaxID=281687 RepID=A0A8R1DKN7_CAEJA